LKLPKKKKQGDPRKTPRSPWGIPGKNPERNLETTMTYLTEKNLREIATISQFLSLPMSPEMRSHLKLLKRDKITLNLRSLGNRLFANTGQNSPMTSKQKLCVEKERSSVDYNRLPGIGKSQMSISGLSNPSKD
jgi:hypothetical protein